MNIQRSMLACAAALVASMSASYAGPCSSEIKQMRDLQDAIIHAKAGADHVPEGVAATTHHQPTPQSIAKTQVQLGQTPPEEFDAVEGALARALDADAVGDQSACEQALADVKRIIGSAGTQTDDVRR